MQDFTNYSEEAQSREKIAPRIKEFFQAIYTWMTLGLVITGTIAFLVGNNLEAIFYSLGLDFDAIFPIMIALMVSKLGLVWFMSSRATKMSGPALIGSFIGYSVLVGLGFSLYFLVFLESSIAEVFLLTGGLFALMSFIGFVTKIDLTKMGSFLMMGLFGIIGASLLNLFLQSEGLYWIISIVGVLVFVGLIAFDTQKLKKLALASPADQGKDFRLTIMGALILYLDFINLFIFLLRIFGRRR